MELITKTYLCEVVSTLEQRGEEIDRIKLLNIQAVLPAIPGGTVLSPSNANGRDFGDELPVAVTTNQSGHDLLTHFGFEEVQ